MFRALGTALALSILPGYGAKNISASTTGYDKPESDATAQVVSSVQVNIVESATDGRE